MLQVSNKRAKAEARSTYHRMFRRRSSGLGPRGSSTPGRTKVGCKADSMDRFFAKAARAYRHCDYAEWCKKKHG